MTAEVNKGFADSAEFLATFLIIEFIGNYVASLVCAEVYSRGHVTTIAASCRFMHGLKTAVRQVSVPKLKFKKFKGVAGVFFQ